ncbi:RNA-binding protein 41-like [Pecten maximus]|uniref:RNA-binding protein 41-like n=1 Tax=Pecten maximus TaxID=6579 RepID=UPI0014587EE4|nr:RNA-binding protein 41-like [Pecten maximus]
MDSYRRTGVPCGNPKRFQSNEVTRMGEGGGRGPCSGPRRDLAGPVEDIETEGEKRLQELLQKQLRTSITRQQIAQGRNFVGGTPFKASTDDLSGVTSLSKFQTLGETDAYIRELKQCGLTEEEVTLKLQTDNLIGKQNDRKRRYGADTSFYRDKLEAIEGKIRRRNDNLSKPDTFSDQKVLTRHEMDLERALVKDDTSSRNLSTALTTQARHKVHLHPDDPMNHLPEILASVTRDRYKEHGRQKGHNSDLQEDLDVCSFPKEREFYEHEECVSVSNHGHNCENTLKQLDRYVAGKDITVDAVNNLSAEAQKSSMLCDNTSAIRHPPETMATSTPISDSNEDNSVNNERHGHIEWVEEEYIVKNRLTPDEIKQIPRFENYSPGTKSKVLFIKNLSNKVTEEDLVALFIRFQSSDEDKLLFRLLTGRMKGQAFVTFPSVEKAMSAMQLVHGLNYKGKPIIIQFGRGPS